MSGHSSRSHAVRGVIILLIKTTVELDFLEIRASRDEVADFRLRIDGWKDDRTTVVIQIICWRPNAPGRVGRERSGVGVDRRQIHRRAVSRARLKRDPGLSRANGNGPQNPRWRSDAADKA